METMEANMAKYTATAIVDGMFMGASLLRGLADAVTAHGGHVEQLHFLQTERGAEVLDKVAEIIAKSEWRIPRSLMERLVLNSQSSGDVCPGDELFWWNKVLNDDVNHLKVPVRNFDHSENRGIKAGSVPEEIFDQLRGQKFGPGPLTVMLEDEEYIVVQISAGGSTRPGEVIFEKNEDLEYIDLAPAKYFDLTR
jgi:hypothetical protein